MLLYLYFPQIQNIILRTLFCRLKRKIVRHGKHVLEKVLDFFHFCHNTRKEAFGISTFSSNVDQMCSWSQSN